jgi:hypothetical protein
LRHASSGSRLKSSSACRRTTSERDGYLFEPEMLARDSAIDVGERKRFSSDTDRYFALTKVVNWVRRDDPWASKDHLWPTDQPLWARSDHEWPSASRLWPSDRHLSASDRDPWPSAPLNWRRSIQDALRGVRFRLSDDHLSRSDRHPVLTDDDQVSTTSLSRPTSDDHWPTALVSRPTTGRLWSTCLCLSATRGRAKGTYGHEPPSPLGLGPRCDHSWATDRHDPSRRGHLLATSLQWSSRSVLCVATDLSS